MQLYTCLNVVFGCMDVFWMCLDVGLGERRLELPPVSGEPPGADRAAAPEGAVLVLDDLPPRTSPGVAGPSPRRCFGGPAAESARPKRENDRAPSSCRRRVVQKGDSQSRNTEPVQRSLRRRRSCRLTDAAR